MKLAHPELFNIEYRNSCAPSFKTAKRIEKVSR